MSEKTTGTDTKDTKGSKKGSILDFFSPERRAEIEREALGSKFADAFDAAVAAKMTLGEFVESISADEHFPVMAKATLSSVLKSATAKARAKNAPLDEGVIKLVLGWIGKHPGNGAAKIAEGSGIEKAKVTKVLAKARKDKTVKMEGDKKSATYASA